MMHVSTCFYLYMPISSCLANCLLHIRSKKLSSAHENGSCFWAVRRRHFLKRAYRYLQCGLAMWCSSLAVSHCESSQISFGFDKCMVLVVVSAHAAFGQCSANSFATLLRLAPSSSHSISLGPTWQGCGCERCGARPTRKTTAQPGLFF